MSVSCKLAIKLMKKSTERKYVFYLFNIDFPPCLLKLFGNTNVTLYCVGFISFMARITNTFYFTTFTDNLLFASFLFGSSQKG